MKYWFKGGTCVFPVCYFFIVSGGGLVLMHRKVSREFCERKRTVGWSSELWRWLLMTIHTSVNLVRCLRPPVADTILAMPVPPFSNSLLSLFCFFVLEFRIAYARSTYINVATSNSSALADFFQSINVTGVKRAL